LKIVNSSGKKTTKNIATENIITVLPSQKDFLQLVFKYRTDQFIYVPTLPVLWERHPEAFPSPISFSLRSFRGTT
jgi:hypothetical protein